MSAEHLPKQGAAADPVRLVAVREVANVALLAPGQKLPFARSGLTAVYGDNGSGKTSYSRILKCACRARGARPDVLPSVYSASPRGTPTALVDYEVGDRQSTFKWCAGADAPEDRQAIKKGMTKTSRWLPGHDQAAALNSAIPDPQELRRDITDLEHWVKAVRTRREQSKKTGTVLRLVETAGQKPESTTDA